MRLQLGIDLGSSVTEPILLQIFSEEVMLSVARRCEIDVEISLCRIWQEVVKIEGAEPAQSTIGSVCHQIPKTIWKEPNQPTELGGLRHEHLLCM